MIISAFQPLRTSGWNLVERLHPGGAGLGLTYWRSEENLYAITLYAMGSAMGSAILKCGHKTVLPARAASHVWQPDHLTGSDRFSASFAVWHKPL